MKEDKSTGYLHEDNMSIFAGSLVSHISAMTVFVGIGGSPP